MSIQTIRSGLITAGVEYTNDGAIFHGPLTFDGEVVALDGSWPCAVNPNDPPAVADALTDTYLDLFAAWCERKDAERKARSKPKSQPRTSIHTPCPALWAGR